MLSYGANTLDITQVFAYSGIVFDKELRRDKLVSFYGEEDDKTPATKKSIVARLRSVPSGCIYNHNSRNYDDYGSQIEGWIVFGSHALNLAAMANFVWHKSGFRMAWLDDATDR